MYRALAWSCASASQPRKHLRTQERSVKRKGLRLSSFIIISRQMTGPCMSWTRNVTETARCVVTGWLSGQITNPHKNISNLGQAFPYKSPRCCPYHLAIWYQTVQKGRASWCCSNQPSVIIINSEHQKLSPACITSGFSAEVQSSAPFRQWSLA